MPPPFLTRLPTTRYGLNLGYVEPDRRKPAPKPAGAHLDTQFLKRIATKVVIQEMPTRRYWVSRGVWTSDVEQATDFQTRSSASEHALRLKLPNAQLVVIHEFRDYQIVPLQHNLRA